MKKLENLNITEDMLVSNEEMLNLKGGRYIYCCSSSTPGTFCHESAQLMYAWASVWESDGVSCQAIPMYEV